MPHRLRDAVCLLLMLANLPAGAQSLHPVHDGVAIDCGSFGRFTLTYPSLDVGQAQPLNPIDRSVMLDRATVTYAGGTQVEVEVSGGSVRYRFVNPPAGFKTYRMSMLIDFGFTEGGSWRMGAAGSKFPPQKPAKPHLYQGNSSTFTLTGFDGRRLAFDIPQYSYEELTDNREWNWKIFNWMFVAPYDPGRPEASVKITEDSSGARTVKVVDRFGQDAALGFPGKVKSEQDLKQDAETEGAYYASFHPPIRDIFGGLPASGQKLGLTRTGYFHAQQRNGKWFLVDPAGNAYFHLGICGFQPGDDYTYIKGRTEQYEWLPPYDSEYKGAFSAESYWSRDVFSFYVANLIRKYGSYDSEVFQKRMIARVRQAGFNGVGAFSGVGSAVHLANFPYVGMLPLGSVGPPIEGLRGIFDPFAPDAAMKMDEAFAGEVRSRAGDPLLIGYFLENEQAFEDIPRVIPGLKAISAAKHHLTALLQTKYGSIAAFNVAWGVNLADFDSLADTALPVTTPAASADMQEFTGQFIEAYYRLIRETFRKYDTNHILLGSRWQPVTANSEQLCRIAAKYCEVLSVNYYTYGVDRAFLKRIDRWAGGKPLLLSEFYWSSPDDTGLPGGNAVKSQRERGLAYRNYVDQAASTGFVVGIEWFILVDQARTGRWFEQYNGEKANTGLFSVTDRPYRDFLQQAALANDGVYNVLIGTAQPFAWNDPRFQFEGSGQKSIAIPAAPGPMRLTGARDEWPGTPPESIPSSRLVVGADGTGFDGSFRLCWDSTNLYLYVQVDDPTPMRNAEQGGNMWNGDGVELFVGPQKPDQDGPLLFGDRQVLISAGTPGDGYPAYVNHAPAQVRCRVRVEPAIDRRGYLLEAAIPFAALGFTPTPGQTIRFDLAIDDGNGQGRQRQLMWNGGARNSGDRSSWGRATFVK